MLGKQLTLLFYTFYESFLYSKSRKKAYSGREIEEEKKERSNLSS